jgi:predicted nucleotidyltransferase
LFIDFCIFEKRIKLKLIEENIDKIHSLCVQYDIQSMHLFGSAISEYFSDSSDIDILISFKEIPFDKYTDNYFFLHEALEKLFNRKVDLITERSLSNPYFIQSIEKSKQLLYAA